jgi:hypothetical protein
MTGNGGSIEGNKLVLVNGGGDADAAFSVEIVPADNAALAVDADHSPLAHLRRQGHEELDFGGEADVGSKREVDALGADVETGCLDGGLGALGSPYLDGDRKPKAPVLPGSLASRGRGLRIFLL